MYLAADFEKDCGVWLSPTCDRGLSDPDSLDGPLWSTVKRQLYRSEVNHLKKLVGVSVIQRNKLAWQELAALRQILFEFQQQNEELSESLRRQVQFSGSQQREFLRGQARIILEDIGDQIQASGCSLEDFVPDLRDSLIREFVYGVPCAVLACQSPVTTPSTRASSSSGLTTPEPAVLVPMGKQLSLGDLDAVADGVREGLEAEHNALLSAIAEQIGYLEAEDANRTSSLRRAREVPLAKLQHFVHATQELATSRSLHALCRAPVSPGEPASLIPRPHDENTSCITQRQPITGGAHVRRLRALIAHRRDAPPAHGMSPLAHGNVSSTLTSLPCVVNGPSSKKAVFDPLFDDPFAT
jgi:hypothetical protein